MTDVSGVDDVAREDGMGWLVGEACVAGEATAAAAGGGKSSACDP